MAKKASGNARFDASMRVVLLHGKESFLKEEATAELGTIDEPVGLGVAAYQGGGEQHALFRSVRRLKSACYTLP